MLRRSVTERPSPASLDVPSPLPVRGRRFRLPRLDQRLERVLEQQTFELRVAHQETIVRLAGALELRSEETGRHVERIATQAACLAAAAGLPTASVELIRLASPLHDIGKIALPDSILKKPGALTSEERRLMESHTTTGYRLLEGSQSDILQLAAEIALSHHERWDGQGYPHRISGPAIPIEARIVTVCDVYDALTNDRVYRNAYTHEEALTLMHAERGTRFEPTLLDLFLTTGPAQEPKLTTSTSRRSRAGGVAGGERSEVALALLASIASGG